jgi:glucokinase
MSLYIAVDIGGTQTRAACYPADSLKPVRLSRTTTHAADPTDQRTEPLERIQDLIASIWPKRDSVRAISVAAPGPTNPYSGVVYQAPNIPSWEDVPLRQSLQERFNVPVEVGNDANLAALCEWKFGAGHGHRHLVYLTISTGIGGGVIIDDKLLLGVHGLAAELGHTTVVYDGPVCSCGQRGHLEAVASGTALAHWVEDQLSQGSSSILPLHRRITARMISEAARKGDQLSLAALARAGCFIGCALASFLHIFNPTVVVIGGGVSRSGPLLLGPMYESMQEHVIDPHYLEDLKLTTAVFGDKAGLVGALALAHTLHP